MSVKDIDRGWNAIMRSVDMATRQGRPVVAVGVQGKEAQEIRDENGVINGAVLAGVHEFGTRDGRIPSRSYMRATIDKMRQEISKTQERMFDLLLQGKLDVKKALGLLGQKVQQAFQKAIEDGLEPPLAESTKKRRRQGDGSGIFKPLLDTGQLRNSITWEIRDGG